MATNYPTSLDTGSTTLRTDITATTELDDVGFYHDEQHVNAHGAVIAVETKLGVGSSDASAAGAGTVLVHSGSGSTGWSAAATGVTSVGTLSSLTVSGDVTVDTDTLHVDSTNDRVGVGTTSPGAQLEIANTGAGQLYATADGFYVVQSKSQLDTLFLRSQGPVDISSDFDGGTSNDYIRFLTDNSTERMRITSDGNVGIGVTDPAGKLTLNHDNADGVVDFADGLLFTNNAGGGATEWTHAGIVSTGSSGFNGNLVFGTDGDSTQNTSGITERMRIDSSGKVGIGTTSPVAGVDIATTAGDTWTTSSWVSGLILNSGSALRWRTGTVLDWGMGATSDYFYVMSSTASDASSAATYRIIIDSSGHTFITNSVQTGQSTFTREPWAASTIALGNYGYVGTEGSYGLSLAWNWERGTDSGFHSLGVNSYTSAAAMHMRNDGIRFQYESSWGATAEPAIHTLMASTELLVYKDLRLYETSPILTLQDSNSTGASNAEILFRDQASTVLGRVAMNGNDDLSIRAETSASVMYFWAQGNWRFYMTSVQFLPYVDNAYDLGATGKRFDDVYATNGTIQTSDVRDKTDIVDIDYGLDFVNSLRPVTYRWDDRSGYVGTRTHMGFIAQEVETALGDDAATRAVWVDSPAGEYKNADTGEYEPGVERQSLRYEEMIAPMVKAIQELAARVEVLEVN